MVTDNRPIQRPIFILGAHKSGSSLVRSLLDEHPVLFVVPAEAHFFQMAHFWVDYRLRRARPPVLSFSVAKKAYTELIGHYNTVFDFMSDSNLVGRFDLEVFRQELSVDEEQTLSDLYVHYMRAIHASLFHRELPTNVRIVEKSVENTEFAVELQYMFPDARFVHILRNPYSNLVSLRRHVGRAGYPFLAPSLSSLYNTLYNLYRNRRLIEDYLVIRYEDLLTDPELTMRSVASFLEIDFVASLLEPTSMGRPWEGNSSRGIRYSGISAENLDLWRSEVTDLEIHYVNRLFKFVLDEYAYESLIPRRSRFRPIRNESLRTYFLNRLISFYL